MKKLIAITLMAALAVMTVGPALTAAGTPDPSIVGTGLTIGTAGGDRPFVKAKWEMKGKCFDASGATYNACSGVGEGLDDSDAPGSQFNAPGTWGADMNYTVCAIASDLNGVADIDGVYADIYYPLLSPMHISEDPNEIDAPSGGCGAFIEENTLIQLSKDQGIQLVCDSIKNGNPNLPVIETGNSAMFANLGEFYQDVCDPSTGQLVQELAYVYCDDKSISWEHPAGNYRVEVTAHDAYGPGEILENHFTYMAFTGFEVDFDSITYKNVTKDIRNQVPGDRNFGYTPGLCTSYGDDTTCLNNSCYWYDGACHAGDGKPTVRNLGNTRLNMLVAQDDMGFGQSSSVWNVQYDARVGTLAGDWHNLYNPFKYQSDPGDPTGIEAAGDYAELYEILDLSETEKMDFVILVHKWEHGIDETAYTGTIWLDADFATFDISLCGTSG